MESKRIVAVMLAIMLVMSLFAGCGPKASEEETHENVFFAKDGILMMYEPGLEAAKEVVEFTGTLHDFFASDDLSEIYFMSSVDDFACDIYYVDMTAYNGQLTEPVKIANDAENYALYEDGYLFYQKGSKLYLCKNGESQRICTDATYYYYEDDKILYIADDLDATAYVISLDHLDAKKKIATGMDNLIYNNDDFSKVIYESIVEGDQYHAYNLYEYANGDSKLIAKEIYSYSIDDDGTLYYGVSTNDEEIKSRTLYDYVNDDCDDSDATEPVYSDYYITIEENGYAYETIDTERYDADYAAYSDALFREHLRERLKEADDPLAHCDVYLYKNGKSELVASDAENFYTFYDTLFVVPMHDYTEVKAANLSELESEDDLYDILNSVDKDYTIYISQDGRNLDKLIDIRPSMNEVLAGLEKVGEDWYVGLYTGDDYDYEGTITLYKAELKAGRDANLREIDEVDHWFTAGDRLFYFKDLDNESIGDFYTVEGLKPVKIDEDVCDDYDFIGKVKDDAYAYAKEGFKGEGTMYIYENGKSVRVADDVYEYAALADRLLYIKYKGDSLGDLCVWDGNESKVIETDISVFGFGYKSLYFI